MDESEKKEIGGRLKDYIVQNYESIDAFARSIDIEPSSLRSIYLKGKSVPGAAILKKLAKAGCDIHWLLTGDSYDARLEKLKEENRDLKKVNSTLITQAEKFTLLLDELEKKKKRNKD